MTYARMGWAFLLTALLCVPSFALAGQKIDLRQSDGTITELGGDGSAANVKCVSGCAGDSSLAEQQSQTTHLATIANAAVRTLTIASGVTTNTTSTPIAGVRGSKTYWAKVDGTGAVTATVQFNGCQTAATTYCVPLGSITLSDTTQDYDVPSPANGTADYPYLGITTTGVTGTGATVVAGVNY